MDFFADIFQNIIDTKTWEIFLSLCGGFGQNLFIFAITLIAALPLGLLITFGSMSKFKPLKWFTKTFVWIIRGTPLMLQLFVVLYAPGLIQVALSNKVCETAMEQAFVNFMITFLGLFPKSRMGSTLFAFIVNYAAYFSEIYRGGIESIPVGQYEAGQVLGMTRAQVFFKVVLMQVIKRVVAPMSNEVLTLVKDTSLARVIGITEVIMCAERFTKQGLIMPLFSTALYFLAMCGILTLLFGYIEKKFDYYKG